jgi:thiosulfate reductase cytochrome b subunit
MSSIAVEGLAPGERLVVEKHHPLVRLTHWLNVPLLLGLTMSGISIFWAAPVYKKNGHDIFSNAFYDHFSLGRFNLAGALRLHWLLVYLFMLNGLLYVIGLALGGGWRALLPSRRDASESFAMVRYYLGVVPMFILRRPWKHPRIETKYNALQKGAYASIPVAGLLAILSGWAMHKPAMLPWLERLFGSYDGARQVHFLVMWYFIFFLVPHLVLVTIDGWDTMRSMIAGWSERIGGAHD